MKLDMSKVKVVAVGGESADEIFGKFNQFNDYVSIYVPSTIQVDRPINNEMYVNGVSYEMTKIFGGCTTFDVSGGYMASSGDMIREGVVICKSFCRELTGDLASKVIELALHVKTAMEQEVVAIEYNGKMVWV